MMNTNSLPLFCETFRPMQPVMNFHIPPRRSVEDCASSATASVSCQDDDNLPLPRMAHIPRKHFAKIFFDKEFVQRARNFAWFLDGYGGLRDHGLVESCRDNPATFSRVAEQNGTAICIAFFKTCLVEVLERGYGNP